jgi:hypothetical protein
MFPIFLKAQINWGDYSQSFPSEVQHKKDALGIILLFERKIIHIGVFVKKATIISSY